MIRLCYYLIPLLLMTNVYAQEPMNNHIIINEILFNPAKDGFDYIEGYNRSQESLSLHSLMVANRNATGDIANIKVITRDSLLLRAGQYFVITANEKWLRQNYTVSPTATVFQLSSMPSLPDDEGTVVFIRRSDSAVVDEVSYSDKWHFKMIKDVEGVALERIDFNLPANNHNWTSAAKSSGSGTPGSVNSQFRDGPPTNTGVAVLPKMFTPNNDGIDDFARVSIQMHDQGKIANALVYDASGRRVRYLIKNELLGSNNIFTWDGCDDRSQRLPTGIYIIATQVFDASGNSKRFRHCIVLSDLR